MILRRITKHVKDQNWVAVGVDFLIVVFGVFIGLQVENWNDTVRDRAKEAIVLEQLAEEFAAAVKAAKTAKIESDAKVQATRDVLNAIQAGKEPEDKAAFLQTLTLAGSFESGPPEPVTLTELLSSGGLSDLSSPILRTALVQYHETSTDQLKIADLVLERISTPHDGFHEAILVNPDWVPPSGDRLIGYDWPLIAGTRQQFQVLLYGKLSLQFYIDQQITLGEAVLAEIEKARK